MVNESRLSSLAAILTRDPSGRGVAGLRPWGGQSCAAALEIAASRLLDSAGPVGVVTGFYIPAANSPAAETDGPLGALALGRALAARGRTTHLITDAFAAPLLKAGRDFGALRASLQVVPWSLDDYASANLCAREWMAEYLRGSGAGLGALVSIERVGPAHTSATAMRFDDDPDESTRCFLDLPSVHHDRRHNMRGEIIDRYTPPLDRLFEMVKESLPNCFTLGIGDGGNEIGMGCFPWRQLREAIQRGPGGEIACRVATDEVLTAGISNWGAYALVAAMAILDPSVPASAALSVEGERELLNRMVQEAGAVDGVTLERSLSVDGVGVEEYVAPLAAMLAI